MAIHNIFTCQGFGKELFGGCGLAWFNLVILFFCLAICRKWLGEEMDIPFEFWLSLIGGILIDVIVLTFTGSFKWALGAGLITGLVVGYGTPYFFGGENS